MNIATINEAIQKIMSINPDLNELALHNLLVASGWDEEDVKSGLNTYRGLMIAKVAAAGKGFQLEEADTVKSVENRIENVVEEVKGDAKEVLSTFTLDSHTKEDPKEEKERELGNIIVYVNVGLLILLIIILCVYILRFRLY